MIVFQNRKVYWCYSLLLLILICFLLRVNFNHSKKYNIILNEVCACNNSVFYDSNGNFNDYIEFYNPTDYDLDLSGYMISDSKKQLDKFIFPENTIIKAKDYFLVWARDIPVDIATDLNFLYTGFSLSKGEKLYFADSNMQLLEKIKIPKNLECDNSYSRIPLYHYWAEREASPLRKNPPQKTDKPIVASKVLVNFSRPSGFYNEPFELILTAPKDYDIYYTLDSTKPSANSKKYIKPIKIYDASGKPNRYANIQNISSLESYTPNHLIDKATVVRAIAVHKRYGFVSEIGNASYFVGFANKPQYKDIPIISVITDPENLFGYEKGIYVKGKLFDMNGQKELPCYKITSNYTAFGKDWARDIYADYMTENSTIRLIGKFKIQGKCSRHYPQKNFTFFDLQKINASDIAVSDFNLRAINTFSRINENLVYQLTASRSEILPYQHEDIVNLFLNGEFWGTYIKYAKLTPDFIVKNTHLTDASSIDMQKNDKLYGSPDFKTQYTNYEEIKGNINIESLISYVVINTYISNLDACNLLWWNVVKWRSFENSLYNKWQFMLYDLDNNYLNAEQNQFKKHKKCNLIVENPFLENLFLYDDFRKKFIITFLDIANYNFNPQNVNKLLDEIDNKYGDAITSSFDRYQEWGFCKHQYDEYIRQIRDFYNYRFKYIIPYMKEYFKLKGKLIDVHKLPSKINGGNVIFNTLKLKADENYIGRYYSDYDVSLDVDTFVGYRFKGWLIDGKLVKKQDLNLKINRSRKIEAVWEKIDNISKGSTI